MTTQKEKCWNREVKVLSKTGCWKCEIAVKNRKELMLASQPLWCYRWQRTQPDVFQYNELRADWDLRLRNYSWVRGKDTRTRLLVNHSLKSRVSQLDLSVLLGPGSWNIINPKSFLHTSLVIPLQSVYTVIWVNRIGRQSESHWIPVTILTTLMPYYHDWIFPWCIFVYNDETTNLVGNFIIVSKQVWNLLDCPIAILTVFIPILS